MRAREGAIAVILVVATGASPLHAQQHGGDLEEHEHAEEHAHAEAHAHDGAGHHGSLHFTHPMIAETVSPDTKVRFDHQYFSFPDGDVEHSAVLEGEYAFTRSFSVEAAIPYSYSAAALGNASVMFKLANYAFEGSGVLLGYGLELGLPTNGDPDEAEPHDDHDHEHASVGRANRILDAPPSPRFHGASGVEGTLGTDEWEVAPFLNVGFRSGPVELLGWGFFGIPFDQAEQAEVETELSWNLSGLYHVSSRVDALLELDGSGGISGPAVGEDVVQLSPGARVRLLPDSPLVLGTSVGFPLASGVEEDPFDVRWKTSLFWHF